MKSKLFYIALLLFISFSSCDDSFLEQEYKNGLVDVNFFKTPDHAKSALTAVYDVLGFEGQYNIARKVLGSSSADDILEDHGDFSRVGAGMIEVDKYTWNSSSRYILDHWYSSYKGIKRANDVIANVPLIKDLSSELSIRYVSEAKALRALFYYNLVTAFGDIPLITEPISPNETKNLTNDPSAEIWAQIVTDLEGAKSKLPATYDAANLGRVTSGFCNAMLSKVYLWTGEYQKAIDAANAVSGYSLEPKYADIYNGVAESGKEIILDVMMASGAPTEDIWHTERSEVNRSILYGPFFAWSKFNQPSRNFIDNMFTANDVRKGPGVLLDHLRGDVYDRNGDGNITSPADDIPANDPVNAHVIKYVKKGADLNSGTVWSGGLQTVNVIITRYAEVLLNLAEAYNESGQGTKALIPLNSVRQRAGLDAVTTTDKTQLKDIILKERALEFAWEGHRFFDLKRAGKLSEVLSPLGWQPHMTVFPIPQTEIDLTEMKQNKGF
jgi:starch-binding outer membrane protein, SusD/RagB family